VSSVIDRATVLATVLASIFGIIIGAAVGLVTTFTHHQFAPWGLVAGLAVIAALLAGFRLVFDSRIIAAAAALGVLLATAALVLIPGAGGTALVVDDAIGWIWAIAPTVIAVVIVSWPRHAQKSVSATE
jgi:N-acetyl-1-D-myo-inositol-2-amino-2-deoxy-alpha-D-glucopyranoside deacetylase